MSRDLSTAGPVIPWLRTRFDENEPALSPDGHWLAYTSNETGRYEVYVGGLPEPGGRVAISNGGGTRPVWAHSGRALYYRTPQGDLIRAFLTFGAAARVITSAKVPLPPGRWLAGYDVHPNDRQLVLVENVASEARTVLQVTANAGALPRLNH